MIEYAGVEFLFCGSYIQMDVVNNKRIYTVFQVSAPTASTTFFERRENAFGLP